jgi:hypothetical protein
MKSDKSWNFEIIPTSIYNFYSTEPEIARSIKTIFSKERPENVMMPEIDEKLQKILDINLKLMDKVVSELSEVKRVLLRLSPSDISQSLFSVPFEKVPVDYVFDNARSSDKAKKRKKKTKSESHIRKSKPSKMGGPPKRLKELPVTESEDKETMKSEKIDVVKIKEIKASLEPAMKTSIKAVETSKPKDFPSTPPMAPGRSLLKLESLKPPPPPPKIVSNKEIAEKSARSQVISELKDMFRHRGLVSR